MQSQQELTETEERRRHIDCLSKARDDLLSAIETEYTATRTLAEKLENLESTRFLARRSVDVTMLLGLMQKQFSDVLFGRVLDDNAVKDFMNVLTVFGAQESLKAGLTAMISENRAKGTEGPPAAKRARLTEFKKVMLEHLWAFLQKSLKVLLDEGDHVETHSMYLSWTHAARLITLLDGLRTQVAHANQAHSKAVNDKLAATCNLEIMVRAARYDLERASGQANSSLA